MTLFELAALKLLECDKLKVSYTYKEIYPDLGKLNDWVVVKQAIKVLTERYYWYNPSYCFVAVRVNGDNIMLVKNQTTELCLIAVNQKGSALRYIKRKTPEICLAAVRKNGHAIQYVPEQTPEMCLATF